MTTATRLDAALDVLEARQVLKPDDCTDTPDHKAEQVLRDAGVPYTYRMIDAKEIDQRASRENRGRIAGTVDDLVSQYAEEMRTGAHFPAICVRDMQRTDGGPRYVIAGGNNRFAAKQQNGISKLYVLVFTSTDIEFEIIARRLNAVEGQRTTKEERIIQAADLVTNRSFSVLDAARALHVARESVRDYLALQRLEALLVAHGVNGKQWRSIAKTKIAPVAQFEDTPLVAVALARVVIADRDATAADIIEFAREVRGCPSEVERIALCESRLREVSSRAKVVKSARAPIRKRFLRCVTELERLTKEHATATELQLERSEIAELRQRCAKLLRLIETCLGG